MSKPKILLIDIETSPTKAYVWKAWDENISPDQVIEHGRILCIGAKWYGNKADLMFSEWEHGQEGMLAAVHALITEADAVIHFNGDRFDMPKLLGQFLLAGMPSPPQPTSIDLLKAVKKFGFLMNRLAYVGPLLSVGAKIKHEGFSLWVKVMAGDVKAQMKMQRYCTQDVRLLETLYDKVKGYIRNHPHLGDIGAACGACGSNVLHRRGYRRTKTMKIQRLQCTVCGSWQDGIRSKV